MNTLNEEVVPLFSCKVDLVLLHDGVQSAATSVIEDLNPY